MGLIYGDGLFWDIHFVLSFRLVVMSVVCFAGGFAFESRMVLLPMKSSYMRFCEFLPASPKIGGQPPPKLHTWDRSCGNLFGSNNLDEMGVVEQGVYFDNSHLSSIRSRQNGKYKVVCLQPNFAYKMVFPYRMDFQKFFFIPMCSSTKWMSGWN